MSIKTKNFLIPPGAKVNLKKLPTHIKPVYSSPENFVEIHNDHLAKLRSLQSKLYAQDQYSLLVIFQALDAAGKDSAIKHVMSGLNPQGCSVTSFKHPSDEELSHDFLWNATRHLPENGRIGIFNRSYYEEVLITRVHPEILRAEHLPVEIMSDASMWEKRYHSIVEEEKHLHRNGTKIIKIFLHLSKEEQRIRFLKRIDDPDKNWKLSVADIQERKFWKDYQHAYEQCLHATSTTAAPWYAVPADDKQSAWLIVSQIILEALQGMKLAYPRSTAEQEKELKKIRRMLS